MATRPELHIAVPKTKNKASEYNDNFDMMMQFVDDSIGEAKDYVDNFMPEQTGHSGQFLKTDGSEASWSSPFTTNNTWSGTNGFNSTVTLASTVNCSGAATFTGTTKVPASSVGGTALQLSAHNKSSSGYMKFGNGVIIQWGTRNANGAATVSFPTAFSSASSYSVTASPNYSQNTYLYTTVITDRNSSNFHYYSQGTGVCWLAIGY